MKLALLEEIDHLPEEEASPHQLRTPDVSRAEDVRSGTNVKVIVKSLEYGTEDDLDSDSDEEDSDNTEIEDEGDGKYVLIRMPRSRSPVHDTNRSKRASEVSFNSISKSPTLVTIDVPSKFNDFPSVNTACDGNGLATPSSTLELSLAHTTYVDRLHIKSKSQPM